MESLISDLELKIKQGTEFDKSLKYLKEKVLLPSRLGLGGLAPKVFSQFQYNLDQTLEEIETVRQMIGDDDVDGFLAEIEEIEGKLDDDEKVWKMRAGSEYVTFDGHNATNGTIISPITPDLSQNMTYENQSILMETPEFDRFVARRLNFEESTLKKF